MKKFSWVLGVLVSCGLALAAAQPGSPAAWSNAFPLPTVPMALHLNVSYSDAAGHAHTLEFWRDAQGRVVRRTDNRVELRLIPSLDAEDAYQLRDLQAKVAYDVHRINLYRIGIFTDRWSTQHLLEQPRGPYTLTTGGSESTSFGLCQWTTLSPAKGAAMDICWSSTYGIPLRERSGTRELFTLQQVQMNLSSLPDVALPSTWQVFNADEDIAPD